MIISRLMFAFGFTLLAISVYATTRKAPTNNSVMLAKLSLVAGVLYLVLGIVIAIGELIFGV